MARDALTNDDGLFCLYREHYLFLCLEKDAKGLRTFDCHSDAEHKDLQSIHEKIGMKIGGQELLEVYKIVQAKSFHSRDSSGNQSTPNNPRPAAGDSSG